MIYISAIREYLEDPVINLIIATILGVLTTILVDKVRERIKRLWWGVKNST
jgi:predicted PurR-regulated permease PerM